MKFECMPSDLSFVYFILSDRNNSEESSNVLKEKKKNSSIYFLKLLILPILPSILPLNCW